MFNNIKPDADWEHAQYGDAWEFTLNSPLAWAKETWVITPHVSIPEYKICLLANGLGAWFNHEGRPVAVENPMAARLVWRRENER